jgi:anthranilate synthase/aminodeoxychorismate synthase-like glutamine amidotransferase
VKTLSDVQQMVVIDNYDSFTYNLVQYLGILGAKLAVYRNDEIDLAGLEAVQPSHLIISPGPCSPKEAGISVAAIRHFAGRIPILGVCLGHQSLGEAFGGRIIRAPRLMHGKTSLIYHDGRDIFQGIPSPFEAIRYHSLIVERETLPECLEVAAQTAVGEIMGLRHKQHAIFGVQFHPESILTVEGINILQNFIKRRRG